MAAGFKFAETILEISRNKEDLYEVDVRGFVYLSAENERALARALQSNTVLTKLDLWYCCILDEGAVMIARALESNTSLLFLTLNDGYIADACAVALAAMLTRNTTLRGLSLNGNHIGDVGLKAISRAQKINTTCIRVDVWTRRAVTEWFTRKISRRSDAAFFTAHLFDERTPDLGEGQYLDSGGDLAELPNEMLMLVAARIGPHRSLIELAHTCRLLRDCALSNYVAFLRYGPGRMCWKQHFREVEYRRRVENDDIRTEYRRRRGKPPMSRWDVVAQP